MTFSPTVQRRLFATELRQLRERAGLDAIKVSKGLEWDAHKVYRLERTQFRRIKRREVDDLLTVYGVNCPIERDRIHLLAEQSCARGWWEENPYAGMWRGKLPDLEAGAVEIYTFDALCIPGLLQTPSYAQAMFAAWAADFDGAELQCRVDARMARQDVLAKGDAPLLHAVIDEAALTKQVGGPAVMREQIRQLVEMAHWPGISIRVIPSSAGAHASMGGSFTWLEFSEHDPIIYLETPVGSATCLEKADEVAQYMCIYDRLLPAAMPAAESVMFLMSKVDELTMRGVQHESRDPVQEEFLQRAR
ncbi:MAG: helix-turn-helix domain-containing protein [Gemmatimonadaceae bacterium]